MIDKKDEQEALAYESAEQSNYDKEAKRVKSFEGTGATYTTDHKIIIAHAGDADFNSNECFTDYLISHLRENGIDEVAKEMNTNSTSLVMNLLGYVSDDVCQDIVSKHFTERVL